MFKRGVKYEWLEHEGYYVPEDNRESAAMRLRPTLGSFRYIVTDWQIVHSTSGVDVNQERERFDFSDDKPPMTRIHCKLENDRRRFHVLSEEGIEPFTGGLTLDIYGGEATEGQLRHWPGNPEDKANGLDKEAITASLIITNDRMDWLVGKLTTPKAVFTLGLKARLFKEEIALAFDEGWMPQNFVLKSDEGARITGYDLSIGQKPAEVIDRVEAAGDDEGELGTNLTDEEAQAIAPPAKDKRLDYIIYILVAIVVALLLK